MNIHELNERRARLGQVVMELGATNRPTNPEDELKAAARYRLASDAYAAADQEYRDALNRLSAAELEALVTPHPVIHE